MLLHTNIITNISLFKILHIIHYVIFVTILLHVTEYIHYAHLSIYMNTVYFKHLFWYSIRYQRCLLMRNARVRNSALIKGLTRLFLRSISRKSIILLFCNTYLYNHPMKREEALNPLS